MQSQQQGAVISLCHQLPRLHKEGHKSSPRHFSSSTYSCSGYPSEGRTIFIAISIQTWAIGRLLQGMHQRWSQAHLECFGFAYGCSRTPFSSPVQVKNSCLLLL